MKGDSTGLGTELRVPPDEVKEVGLLGFRVCVGVSQKIPYKALQQTHTHTHTHTQTQNKKQKTTKTTGLGMKEWIATVVPT